MVVIIQEEAVVLMAVVLNHLLDPPAAPSRTSDPWPDLDPKTLQSNVAWTSSAFQAGCVRATPVEDSYYGNNKYDALSTIRLNTYDFEEDGPYTDNVCGPFPTLRLDSGGREFKGDCEDGSTGAIWSSIMDGELHPFQRKFARSGVAERIARKFIKRGIMKGGLSPYVIQLEDCENGDIIVREGGPNTTRNHKSSIQKHENGPEILEPQYL